MVTEEREKKIVDNLGLVHSIANRFKNRGAEYEDLVQAGCIGLIKAVDNFDESRGFMFSTYAVPVIMGEIKRIFRDGGAVKVSRSLKEKAMLVQDKRSEFVNREMREPTVSELAGLCGLEPSELSEILGIISPTVSLSVESEEGSEELDIPVNNEEEVFDRITVSCILTELEADERKLIYLRYFEGKTQSESAAALNISQVQVSRREKAILNKLKKKLV